MKQKSGKIKYKINFTCIDYSINFVASGVGPAHHKIKHYIRVFWQNARKSKSILCNFKKNFEVITTKELFLHMFLIAVFLDKEMCFINLNVMDFKSINRLFMRLISAKSLNKY